MLKNSAVRYAHGRGLRKTLHCSCGHVVDFHDARGCCGVGLRGAPCDCSISDSAALEAGLRSFEGSHARLRRWVRRNDAVVLVKRAVRSQPGR
jgi:hypothetical protein